TKTNPATGLTLRLVGQVQEDLTEKVNNEKIKFEGVVTYDKIPGIISDAYFMIAPSLMDNLPTVGIEAFSYGTPVVASNRGGWPEIVENSVNGLIIEPDVDNIMHALKQLDLLSLDNYRQYSANARKRYEQYFTPSQYAIAVEKIIH